MRATFLWVFRYFLRHNDFSFQPFAAIKRNSCFRFFYRFQVKSRNDAFILLISQGVSRCQVFWQMNNARGWSGVQMTYCVQVFTKSVRPPTWPNGLIGHRFAPPDTPPCGFYNEFCKSQKGSPDHLRGCSQNTYRNFGTLMPLCNTARNRIMSIVNTLRAKAARCIVIAPVCVFVCVFVCGSALLHPARSVLRRLWALFHFEVETLPFPFWQSKGNSNSILMFRRNPGYMSIKLVHFF